MVVNMVSSVDGRGSVEGKASGLGTAADRTVMRTLRSRADAVMIGGGTLRAEKLSLSLDREDTGAVPLAIILTNTGNVPLGSMLIRDSRQHVVVLLGESAPDAAESRLEGLAEIRRVPEGASGMMDTTVALETIKSDYDVDVLLVEGGPSLNRSLTTAHLVDELFVTLAPRLVGGSASNTTSILDGPLKEPQALRLLSAHLVGEELFLRYSLNKGDAGS